MDDFWINFKSYVIVQVYVAVVTSNKIRLYSPLAYKYIQTWMVLIYQVSYLKLKSFKIMQNLKLNIKVHFKEENILKGIEGSQIK